MSQNTTLADVSAMGGGMAYYEGTMSNLPRLMVGKLLLTQRYLAFHPYEIHSLGLLEKTRLVPSGKVIGLSLERVVDASVETSVRSKRSRPNWREKKDFDKKASGEKPLNARPRPLDAAEKFRQLMVTYEADRGLEVAIFEVDDPEHLLASMRNFITTSKR